VAFLDRLQEVGAAHEDRPLVAQMRGHARLLTCDRAGTLEGAVRQGRLTLLCGCCGKVHLIGEFEPYSRGQALIGAES
jgi:hypothetical protein